MNARLPPDAPLCASAEPRTPTHEQAARALAQLPQRAALVLVIDTEAPLHLSISAQGVTARESIAMLEVALIRLSGP